VDPHEAAQIHIDLGARYSVGMHFGTFPLTCELIQDPMIRLREARLDKNIADKNFFVLKHGETRVVGTDE
jgi:N-acyl-phosphatidylethanolamine-hydrolysing phospholipase D